MAEESQALAIRSVPLPAVIRELGVRVADDANSGQRLVLIPREVRAQVNVIDPVTSLAQADPNWTPRISVVELDPNADNGPHFYKQAGNKLAPSKQALETLAKGAGILYTKTARIPRAELDDGEIGYRATIGIRRSDGTIEEITREKVWVEDAERAEIEEAVTNSRAYENGQRTNKPKYVEGTAEWHAEVKKRWLKELKDRYAKTESKAVLRAIRAALQIPHTFSPADARKPFLVIGFNFTPDYNDAEMRRALVAAGLNPGGASEQLYGPRAIEAPVETIDMESGVLTPAEEPVDVDGAADEADTVAERPSLDDVDDEQAGGGEATAEPQGAAAGSSHDDIDWDAVDGAAAPQPWSGDYQVPGGRFEGKTISQVAKTKQGRDWLAGALDQLGACEFRDKLESYMQTEQPELWAAYEQKRQAA